jgi:hypothetical protein
MIIDKSVKDKEDRVKIVCIMIVWLVFSSALLSISPEAPSPMNQISTYGVRNHQGLHEKHLILEIAV